MNAWVDAGDVDGLPVTGRTWACRGYGRADLAGGDHLAEEILVTCSDEPTVSER
ncbi:MAG: hypothetical protein ACOZNI_13385 [Myxococcota bacterium]